MRPRRILLAALLTLCSLSALGQQVTTLVPSINASGDLSLGPDGNLYVADFGDRLNNANGNTVYRVTPVGEVTVFATGLAGPSGNEFDAAGNLIQANIAGNRVDRIDPQGNVTTIASTGFASPVGIAIGADGTIFVANCGGNSVSQIVNGAGVAIASGNPLSCPNGLAIDDLGNLYAANFNNGNIVKVTPAGQMSILATTPSSSFRPSGGNGHITFSKGRLYVVSNATAQVFELTLDGALTVIAGDGTRGHNDGPLLESSFSSPNGITLSPDGRFIYVNEAQSTQGTVLSIPTFPLNPSLVRTIDRGAGLTINPGMNGAWFNPDTSGQGLLFDIIASQQVLFAAWFTFDAAGAKIGAPEHRWLIAQGSYQGDTATLDVFSTDGGVFDEPTPVSSVPEGTASLTFTSCTEAQLDYTLDQGPSGSIPLIRLTPDVFCAALSDDNP